MDWIIHPLNGMGPLTFGMTQAQVAEALAGLAPVSSAFPSADGRGVDEFRAVDVPSTGYVADGLVFIGTSPQVVGVRLGELDVFAAPPLAVLQALERANGGARAGLGSVVFDKLRIATTNFYDEAARRIIEPPTDRQDDRTLSVSRDDELAGLAEHYHPISFL